MQGQMSKLFDLSGKRALITGSSQGIGLALARGLAQHGASVILNGRSTERLKKARNQLRDEGFEVSGAAFDVTEAGAVKASIGGLEMDGPIDILINNAGMQFRTRLEDYPEDVWDKILKTNITSAFLAAKYVVKGMMDRKAGKIINIASVQSELARPGIAPYTATKGAIRNLTRGMATDWAKHGIQVNAIAPGYFKTPLNQELVEDENFSAWLSARTPAGRWGDVEELVGAAVFLSGPASSFVNGQTIYVDGGITASI